MKKLAVTLTSVAMLASASAKATVVTVEIPEHHA